MMEQNHDTHSHEAKQQLHSDHFADVEVLGSVVHAPAVTANLQDVDDNISRLRAGCSNVVKSNNLHKGSSFISIHYLDIGFG